MEMKITKTVTVEFDNSLGYPIAFVKAGLLSNEGAARAVGEGYQSAMLRYIEDLDAGRIDLEYLGSVIKEYVLLCWRLLHGFLYYPAYNRYVGRAPYNCGPKYIGAVDDSLDKYDRKVGSEFNTLCDKLTDQIADYVLSTIKEDKYRAAVEKMGRKEVIFDCGNVYFKMTPRDSLPELSPLIDFLAVKMHKSTDKILVQYGYMLQEGKAMLNLPQELLDDPEYWEILTQYVGPFATEDVKVAAKEFYDVLNCKDAPVAEQPAKGPETDEPLPGQHAVPVVEPR